MTQNKKIASISPAEIMRQIRKRVLEEVDRRRAEHGTRQGIQDSQIESMLQDMSELGVASPWEGRHVATSYPYPLKPLALKIRRLIQEEIRWALDPFIEEQRRLNTSSTAVIRSIWESLKSHARSTPPSLQEQLIKGEAIRQLAKEINNVMLTDLSRPAYKHVAFWEEARGSPSLIRSRQAVYVDHFQGRRNVLDVGCGRGEFLQLLKEIGVDAYGIDSDPNMVKYVVSCGLRALEADAIEHLRGLEDQTLGGVFCSQVIEHMNVGEALVFLNLTHEKLMPESKIVIETVNPTSLCGLAEFYRDPTHIRPIHPSSLKSLLEGLGFTSVEIQYRNEPPQSDQLEPITGTAADIATINSNFKKLNALLWGPMDYAAIGIR